MARGFGATFGVGTTDVITSAYTTVHSVFTWSVIAHRNGDGGGGIGRLIFKDGNVIRLHVRDATDMLIAFPFSTTDGKWSFPKPSASADHVITVTYDATSTANDPIVYVDGSSVTVTRVTAPVGTANTAGTGAWTLGNNAGGTGNWDGKLSEFAMWSVILTAAEAAVLGRAITPQQVRNKSIVEYIPMMRDNVSRRVAPPSITGTAVQPHPRVSYHKKSRFGSKLIAGGTLYSVTVTDRITLPDSDGRDSRHGQLDTLAVPDADKRLVSRILLDGLLLNDATVYGIVRTLIGVDTLPLSDARVSKLDLVLADTLLTYDAMIKLLEKRVTDTLPVYDAATLSVITGVITRLITDTVLMADAAVVYQTKQFTDTVPLVDTVRRLMSVTREDAVLLADTRAASMRKTLLDQLALQDADSRGLDKYVTESVILNDATALTYIRALADTLLINDYRNNLTSLTTVDTLLIDSLAKRVRTLLIQEGLLFVDTATAAYIEYLATALTHGTAQAVDILGMTHRDQPNLLGFSSADADICGMTTGVIAA